jgi:ferredoxin-type protein NapH
MYKLGWLFKEACVLVLLKDKNKRLSYLRTIVQIVALVVIFYLAILTTRKALLLILIFGSPIVLGRFFCGWLCPFGLYMDIITWLRKIAKIRYWALPEKLNTNLHRLRYFVALDFLAMPLVMGIFFIGNGSFLNFDNFARFQVAYRPFSFFLAPLETLIIPFRPPFGALLDLRVLNINVPNVRALSFPYVGEIMALNGGKGLALLIAVTFVILTVAASFKVRRFWCRFCPTGISIAILNKLRQFTWMPLLHLSKDEEKCTKCGICKRVCPVQVTEVYEKKGGEIRTSKCLLCLRCVEMCPYPDCLKVTAMRKTLFKSRNWL